MDQNLQSLIKEFLKAQSESTLQMIECLERVWALEAAVIALDQQTIPLLDKMRKEAHDKNRTTREQIQKRLAMYESLLAQIDAKPPN
jgi:hypothetical protein